MAAREIRQKKPAPTIAFLRSPQQKRSGEHRTALPPPTNADSLAPVAGHVVNWHWTYIIRRILICRNIRRGRRRRRRRSGEALMCVRKKFVRAGATNFKRAAWKETGRKAARRRSKWSEVVLGFTKCQGKGGRFRRIDARPVSGWLTLISCVQESKSFVILREG